MKRLKALIPFLVILILLLAAMPAAAEEAEKKLSSELKTSVDDTKFPDGVFELSETMLMTGCSSLEEISGEKILADAQLA